ncbi:hypothetical protein [Pseudothermotoga thermarum]|nr:hypothetical protein [Pseudothermotoga thermarum]
MELLDKTAERIKWFFEKNVGSSICIRCKMRGLAEALIPKVLKELTKDYLLFEEVGIDDVRTIIDFLSVASTNDAKIVVIFQAENMLAEASNALLKTLEEPPSKSTIALVTMRYNDLLPTIRSRVKTFDLYLPKELFEKLREKLYGTEYFDCLYKLACSDFDVLEYLLENAVPTPRNFSVNLLLDLFGNEKLNAQQKILLLYMLNNLIDEMKTKDYDFILETHAQIVSKSEKLDLSYLIIECCRIIQLILESKQIHNLQFARFLDSILSNKLKNFNSSLALFNLLILSRRISRR